MTVEVGAGGERFNAEVAGVWPLSRVDPHVPLQQAWPVKLLTAGLTGQQSLVSSGPVSPWLVFPCLGERQN